MTGCFPASSGTGAAALDPGASISADGSVWRPSVLQAIIAQQQAAAGGGGRGGGVRRTEHGYTYADATDPAVVLAALREHTRR